MAHITRNRDKLLARVRRLKGQVVALEKVLEGDGGDCAATLQQIAAIRGATNGLMTEVLEEHVREHLGSPGARSKERAEDVEVVVAALRSYMK